MLVGETEGWLGASMYLREIHGREDGSPPPVDLARERRTGDLIRALIQSEGVTVVHDLSDGGLLAAAAEMALASGVGIALIIDSPVADHAFVFGEDQARYLIAVDQDQLETLDANAQAAGVPYEIIGLAGGDELSVTSNAGLLAAVQLDALRRAHEGWMPAFMGA